MGIETIKEGKEYLRKNFNEGVNCPCCNQFVKLYKNQPLFGEIDTFIRNKLGLELWDLSKAHWKYSNKLCR